MHLEQLCRQGSAAAFASVATRAAAPVCIGILLAAGKLTSCSRHAALCVDVRLHGAEPNSNAEMWSSVWSDTKQSGICTGLEQGGWMRLATEQRVQYDPDVGALPSGG